MGGEGGAQTNPLRFEKERYRIKPGKKREQLAKIG